MGDALRPTAIRKWFYRHGVRWHAQNLNERRGSTERHMRLGPMWRHGHAWIDVWRGDGDTGVGYRELLQINPEWTIGKRWDAAALAVQFGGESTTEVMLHGEVPGLSLFLTVDARSTRFRRFMERVLPGYWFDPEQIGRVPHSATRRPGWMKVSHETEIALKWHNGGLWWSLWQPTMEWSSRTPKWRNGHFDLADFLLGRDNYTSDELYTVNVEVPMPEKAYAGTVRMHEDTWERPRWPFKRRILRATIDVPGGVPHPGKGENSWDCDDDATYSMTCVARSVTDAVGKLVASVLRDRINYGGRNWRPKVAVP